MHAIIGRDAFIAALDRELQIKVRDRDPKDLSAAYEAAMRVESYLRESDENPSDDAREGMRPNRYGGQRTRVVQQNMPLNTAVSQDVVQQLRDQVSQCLQTQVNTNRELEQLRSVLEGVKVKQTQFCQPSHSDAQSAASVA